MRRREFITLLGGVAAAWPFPVQAQQAGKLPVIGFLGPATAATQSQWAVPMVRRLRELNWIEGRNIVIEYRWAEGRADRAAEVASEFVRSRVDVIVTIGTPTTTAAKAATSLIPIVFCSVSGPVETGLVASLARPGGNITGLSNQMADTGGKRLEILRELVPHLRRLATIGNATNPAATVEMAQIRAQAQGIGLTVISPEIRQADDFATAFESFKGQVDALYVQTDLLTISNRIRINTLALEARLPTMHGIRDFVELGGLVSYGHNIADLLRRTGDYVDKILRGAKPSDLPVEQPTKFDLVLNLTTARALGLTVPPSLLARADEVIEMRRREFITLLGGAAAWPVAARAQQPERMRRIGVLMTTDDAEGQARMGAFLQGLQHLGWVDGRNVRIEARWTFGKADNVRRYVAELAALAPDVIVATGSASVGPLLQTTHAIPIVFAQVVDPVGAGFVESLARPGGNATGFTQYEYGISAKWLELLKEIAPSVTRAAILRDPGITAGIGQWAAIQTVAPALGVELRPVDVRDPGEFERAVAAFARASNGGLIVTGSGSATVHRQRIIMLAARHKLPAVYPFRTFADDGGLISYGPDTIDQFRRAAGYVDRILKGEKPGDLPVQAPTKYELVINLKTARALGLDVPPALLSRADEVIE